MFCSQTYKFIFNSCFSYSMFNISTAVPTKCMLVHICSLHHDFSISPVITSMILFHLTCCNHRGRCRSNFILTIDCHDNYRVACVSIQPTHQYTTLISRHLTWRHQCAHPLPLSGLSLSFAGSSGCDHHMVPDVSSCLHKGQMLPHDPYHSVTDTSDSYTTWSRGF